MSQLKKLLSMFVLCVILISVLASCDGSNNENANSSISSGETNIKDTSSDAGGSKGNSKVEVSIWHYFEHEAEALQKVVDKYNELQDDIHITCTFVSREELMKQYTIGAVSGELPDMGMVDSPDMASFISLGVFQDITDYLEGWEDLEQFYEGPIRSCMDNNGRLYGLPNNSNCLALLCNMDLLRAAGFDEPPTTWQEFYEVCKATADPENGVYGFAMSLISNEEGTFQIYPWLYSAGATVSDINSPEAVEAVSFLSKLVEENLMSKECANWGQGDAYNAFIAGKAAMLESGTWQIATLDEDLAQAAGQFEYQYAYMPKNKQYATVIGGENFGVCAGSEATEECVEFLKYMMTAENNAEWCEIAGKLAVRRDALQYKDFWTTDPRYKVFNDSMEFAIPRGPHESWPTISEAIYTAVQAAVLGEESPQEVLDQAANVIDPILKEVPIAE